LDAPTLHPCGLAYADGRLYVSDDRTGWVFALNLASGIIERSFEAPDKSAAGLTFADGALFVLAGGKIYKVLPDDGTILAFVPAPDPAAVDADPAHGPLVSLPTLAVSGWERIGAPLEGALDAFARDAATGRYLVVSGRYGVTLLDSTLSRALHHVVLDPGFSVDLTSLAGAAFLGGDTLALVATNKSWVLLRPDPAATERAEWRHFLRTDGEMTELGLGRFATVRARQMYVLSLAFDPSVQELVTVSVPNPRHRQLVVSRFARADMLLASEFVPRLGTGLTLKADGKLADYLVTGAAVADGKLYAVSAAYSTLLVIDLQARTVQAAYAVPGLRHPVGVAVRGSQLLIAQADGRIASLARPAP